MHQFGEESVLGHKIGKLPERDVKAVALEVGDHLLRIGEAGGGELVVAPPIGFKPAGVQMKHVAGDLVLAQFGRHLAHLDLVGISAAAHPKAEGPERRHGRFARQRGVFIEDFLGRTEKDKQIQLVIAEHHRIDPAEIIAEITGDGRTGVHEHAVAAAAHEKRNRLVHPLVLDAVGVVRPKHQPLPPLVQTGERFAAAENLLAGRKGEGGVHAAGIIRRAAHEGKRQDGREGAGVVHGVVRLGQEAALGVANLDVEGVFQNGDGAELAGVAMAAVHLGSIARSYPWAPARPA